MTDRKKAWIFSIFLHVIIALILFSLNIQIKSKTEKLPLEITYTSISDEPPEMKEKESLEEIPSKITKTPKKEEIPTPPEERITTYIPEYLAQKHITPEDSIKLLQKSISEYFKEKSIVPFVFNKYEFLDYDHNEKYKEALEQDTLKMLEMILAENFKNMVLSEEEIKNLPKPSDPTADYIFRRQGGSQVMPIMVLITEGIRLAQKVLKKIFFDDNPARADLFLSDIEIQILNIIWAKRIITPSTLYENLTAGIDIRLSNLSDILLKLESKKILISKEGTYEKIYIPAVRKKDVFEYYIRNILELDEIEKKNIPVSQELKNSLLRKIKILNQEPEGRSQKPE